jgi:polar amino acid transport system permease protein
MDLDFSPLLINWRFLASGLLMTLLLSAAVVVGSMVLGFAAGLARVYGPRWLALVLTF